MKGFVLAIAFSIGILFSSQAMAQECCHPVRNAVRNVVTVPFVVIDKVRPVRRAVCYIKTERPVRSAVCCIKEKRPVRRFFGRVFNGCCCNQ
jgi:hypothetical protein